MSDDSSARSPVSRFAPVVGWGLLGVFVGGGFLVRNIYSGDSVRPFGIEVQRLPVWQVLYVLGFAGYVSLLVGFRIRPPRLRMLLIGAILLRLPLLWCQPNNDCNRYIWEGHVQGRGFNPYAHSPSDEQLRDLRDGIWAGINKKNYSTIYPPLAELEFRLLAAIRYSVKSPQVAHCLIDVAVVFALVGLLGFMRRPAWYSAIYGCCPLVLAAFAHAGHSDSLMILCVLGFLAAALRRHWLWAGFALGLAILAKTTPAILLAVLVRRSRLALAVALATVGLGYLIYIDAGSKLFFTLVDFPNRSNFNSPIDEARLWLRQFFDWLPRARGRNYAALTILLGAAAYRVWRPRDLLVDVRWLLAVVLLLLPIIHFWYVTWILALVALQPRGYWAWLVLVGTMALYWQAEFTWQTGGKWKVATWAVALIWVPFYLTWIAETVFNRRRGDRHAGPSPAVSDPSPRA